MYLFGKKRKTGIISPSNKLHAFVTSGKIHNTVLRATFDCKSSYVNTLFNYKIYDFGRDELARI